MEIFYILIWVMVKFCNVMGLCILKFHLVIQLRFLHFITCMLYFTKKVKTKFMEKCSPKYSCIAFSLFDNMSLGLLMKDALVERTF